MAIQALAWPEKKKILVTLQWVKLVKVDGGSLVQLTSQGSQEFFGGSIIWISWCCWDLIITAVFSWEQAQSKMPYKWLKPSSTSWYIKKAKMLMKLLPILIRRKDVYTFRHKGTLKKTFRGNAQSGRTAANSDSFSLWQIRHKCLIRGFCFNLY